jgi:peptide/nickel transport system permease protein
MQGSIEQVPTVTLGEGYAAGMGRRRRWQMLRVLVHNRASLVGLLIIVVMILLGLAANWIAPYAPSQIHIRDKVHAPSSTYWLGTDQFGRDILSRLLYGTRISLTLSVVGVVLATLVGTLIGAIAGFGQRWIDELLMRIMDVLMAFPYIVLAIALIAVVGPSLQNIMLVVAFTRVPQFARLARSSVLGLKHAEYVVAARTVGLPDWRILLRHVLPNIVTPIVVLGSLSMATAILTESSLSFLGLGVQPPTASWGTMIGDGRNYVGDGFWISTVPGIAISLTILGFNLLGDGLRDALDPRLRTRA